MICPLKLSVASYGESSTVRTIYLFIIRSLTPQQATGNAFAVAVQNNPALCKTPQNEYRRQENDEQKKKEAPKLILRQLLWVFFINNQLLEKYDK